MGGIGECDHAGYLHHVGPGLVMYSGGTLGTVLGNVHMMNEP